MELLALFLFGSLIVGIRAGAANARPRRLSLLVVTVLVGSAFLRLSTY